MTNNFAGSDGGGIANFNGALSLTESTVSGNRALSGAGIYTYLGPVTIERSSIANNHASSTLGVGGGLHSAGSAVTIRRSTVSGNSSRDAGGIYASADLVLLESTVSGNSATFDGGGVVSRDTAQIERTLISDNRAGRDGGGIWSKETVSVNSSTIARNVAGRDGGGAWLDAVDGSVRFVQATISGNQAARFGAGLWLANAFANVVSIAHSTIATNEVTGGGLGGGVFVFAGPVNLNHTIVAKNFAAAGSDVTGLFGASISARYSLIGDNSNSGLAEAGVGMPDANGNLVGGGVFGFIDPLLGELRYNGGFTPTHALPSPAQSSSFPSPAVDTGNPQAQAGVDGVPTHDQRGMPYSRFADGDRRSGVRIDMGAFESQTLSLPATLFGDYNRNGRVDAADYTVWSDAMGRVVAPYTSADGNGDGLVDFLDHAVWVGNFGVQGTAFVPIGGGFAALATGESKPQIKPRTSQAENDLIVTPPVRISVPERPLQSRASSGKRAVRVSPLDFAARHDRALESWWATRGRATKSQESRDQIAAKESSSREAIDCAVAEMGQLRLAVRT